MVYFVDKMRRKEINFQIEIRPEKDDVLEKRFWLTYPNQYEYVLYINVS